MDIRRKYSDLYDTNFRRREHCLGKRLDFISIAESKLKRFRSD